MHLESILMVGDDRAWYHKLRSELRSTQYRLLRARNEQVARWLMERVRIGLIVTVLPAAEHGDAMDDAVGNEAPLPYPMAFTGSGAPRPALLIRRDVRVGGSDGSTMPEGSGNGEGRAADELDVLALAEAAAIPLLSILPSHGPQESSGLEAAIRQRADYILFSPYEQSELVQAIRTATLNGRSPERGSATAPPLEISLQDRTSNLDAGREQLARLLAGAVEQVWQARARVSWCESEIRALRQNHVRRELDTHSQTHGLPEVVHGVAHDFANLLEAAGAAATSLYGQPHSPQMYRQAMSGVMEQSQELIEALMELTSSGRQEWRTEPVELDSLVNRALLSALLPLRDPQIRVRVRMGGLEPVWAHHSLVYRALLNLIWNAVQAMPHGGMLSILGYVRGNRVVIEVGDTGVGIPRQDRDRVLQEPFTTKPGHRGMGLTMVRDLLEKCGGEITFTSRPGQGSLFSIALPVARRAGLRPAGESRPRTAEPVLSLESLREGKGQRARSPRGSPSGRQQTTKTPETPSVLQP